MLQQLCPGYFERDVQNIIDKQGPGFTSYFCALCGQQIKPVNKNGGWIPSNHFAYPLILRDGIPKMGILQNKS